MRILAVNAISFVGGAERWLLHLVRGLAPRGHRLDVAHDPRSPLGRDALEAGADTAWTLPGGPAARLRAAVTVARNVRRHRYDVVVSTSRSDLVPAGLGARLAGLPGAVARLNSGWSSDDAAVRGGWTWRRHRAYHRRLVHLAATNSRAGRDDLVARGFLEPERIEVIHNGVDVDRFDPTRVDPGRFRAGLGIPAGAPLVVSLARYAPGRGQEAEIDAAGRLVAAHPELRFVFAGSCRPADRGFREGLRTRARGFPGGDRILFLEEREDVPSLLRDAHVLVRVMSTEGLANVALEAMAMEVPVVGPAIAGMPEAVLEGVTGHLVSPGDAATITAAVERILALPAERRREMGKRGRSVVRERFSLPAMTDRYEALFERARRPA
ncbi:MAG TPA: glycosyltransferase family 4 protein [Gemmatimonadota bacterium]|nr:glycosyltransferase family 4 protein [Gemmatimonadota bacterium]